MGFPDITILKVRAAKKLLAFYRFGVPVLLERFLLTHLLFLLASSKMLDIPFVAQEQVFSL